MNDVYWRRQEDGDKWYDGKLERRGVDNGRDIGNVYVRRGNVVTLFHPLKKRNGDNQTKDSHEKNP